MKTNRTKKWYYRSYSSYQKPRSIITRGIFEAESRKEAIETGRKHFHDYGRYVTAVPVK